MEEAAWNSESTGFNVQITEGHVRIVEDTGGGGEITEGHVKEAQVGGADHRGSC